MNLVLQENHGARRLLAGWLLLALAALVLLTLYALLVAAARTPLLSGFDASRELFQSALVLHVGFAMVVWLLVYAAGLWTLASGDAGPFRWAALILAGAGAAAMALAPWFGTPLALLSNYVPVLDSRLYLSGLVLFAAGIALCGAASAGDIVRALRAGRRELWRIGALLSIAAAGVALFSLTASFAAGGAPVNQADFEELFWGPGHMLQFVHVLLMMTIWIVLGERALSGTVAPRRALAGLLLLAALPILASPLIHICYPVGSPEFRVAYTALMTWGTWPAALLLAASLVLQLTRAGRAVWVKAETLPLILSILLFVLGSAFGAAIQGNGATTMVTAHYHGTVGAVALAYMAFGYYVLLPAFGLAVNAGPLARAQPAIYGGGLIILASALAWWGSMGVPRKTPYVDLAEQSTAALAAMGLLGLGGLLFLVGVVLFVFNIVRSIWQGRLQAARSRTLMLTALLVVAAVLLIAYLPGRLDTPVANGAEQASAAAHARGKTEAEIEQRFGQGVVMLHAKRYDYAFTSFSRVLELAPEMVEVHVNMGFTLLGLERHASARDFFDSAIELRKEQVNAYYGLALALEGMGDVPGALGAMRAYLHLSPADDAYRSQAEAAVAEWKNKLPITERH